MIACSFGVIEVLPCELMVSERPLFRQDARGSCQVRSVRESRNGPACVEVCPTKAIYVIDAAVLAEAALKRREHSAAMLVIGGSDGYQATPTPKPACFLSGRLRHELKPGRFHRRRIDEMAEKVLTVCPYCGSGCKLNLLVENGSIIGAEAGKRSDQ